MNVQASSQNSQIKKIILTPVKNEEWILELFLRNTSSWADKIIIADQNSTDESLKICSKFEKVSVIKNESVGHSNTVRWLLLDEARKSEGNNLIFFLDADELLSPTCVRKIDDMVSKKTAGLGSGFSFDWVQLFGSTEMFRVDSVWKKNIKVAAFWDDRKMDFIRKYVINDHTSRIPETEKIIHMEYPLLHFNHIFKEKYDWKQVWYRCDEYIQNPSKVRKINNKYSIMDSEPSLESTEKCWFKGIELQNFSYDRIKDWRYIQIKKWIQKYGTKFFEPLDIWKIEELEYVFLKENGRKPVIKKYPDFLIAINKIKNKIRQIL